MNRIEDFRRIYAQVVTAMAEVTEPRITEAFARVPREHYLGGGPWDFLQGDGYVRIESNDPACLYQNFLVAIDAERGLNNGEPIFLARMIDLLAPQPGEHVVHIGTGTGYYTAILAELVGAHGRVTAFEVDPELAARSRENLAHYRQVEVLSDSGVGLAASGIDGIYVNAGATHPLAAWLEALAPSGRLVLPLTTSSEENGGRGLVAKIRAEPPHYAARLVCRVGIFHCLGAREAAAEELLSEALEDPRRKEVRSLRREPHAVEETCWLHGDGYCFSTRKAGVR